MKNEKKIKVAAVAGPTGAGKSALAVALARRFGGQIVSCDSMQIYRGMDVGTGKVTAEEMRGVRHRMIDILDPGAGEEFSLAEFIERARKEIEETRAEGALPILCGGTGLYLDRLLDGTELSRAGRVREERAEIRDLTNEELFEKLREIDPESAGKTHPNNRKRVVRALEIFFETGRTKSDWDRASLPSDSPYDPFLILLLPDSREKLYEAIGRRVDAMFENGLEEEARRLFEKGLSGTAAQAIGYKEFRPYFEGECALDEVKERIKQASRNYAKRQMTWFRARLGQKNTVLIDAEAGLAEKEEAAAEALNRFLEKED